MDNSTDSPDSGQESEAPATERWADAVRADVSRSEPCQAQLDDECPWSTIARNLRVDTPPPAAAARLLDDSLREVEQHQRAATEIMNLLRRAG
jgi:hypothetical protein